VIADVSIALLAAVVAVAAALVSNLKINKLATLFIVPCLVFDIYLASAYTYLAINIGGFTRAVPDVCTKSHVK
jgi:hypothetical protein